MNLKFLSVLMLFPLLTKAQHLEISLKQYNFITRSGTVKNVENNYKDDNSLNAFTAGVKVRYIKNNDVFFDGELSGTLGKGTSSRHKEGYTQIVSKSNAQHMGTLSFSVGKNIKVDQLRFSPYFKLGGFYANSGKVSNLKYYNSNNIMEMEMNTYYPKTISLVTGPGLGIDYMVLRDFYFGLDLSYLISVGKHTESYKFEVNYYNENGVFTENQTDELEYDNNFSSLNNLSVALSLAYRIY